MRILYTLLAACVGIIVGYYWWAMPGEIYKLSQLAQKPVVELGYQNDKSAPDGISQASLKPIFEALNLREGDVIEQVGTKPLKAAPFAWNEIVQSYDNGSLCLTYRRQLDLRVVCYDNTQGSDVVTDRRFNAKDIAISESQIK